jgi:hypothetical protein
VCVCVRWGGALQWRLEGEEGTEETGGFR